MILNLEGDLGTTGSKPRASGDDPQLGGRRSAAFE